MNNKAHAVPEEQDEARIFAQLANLQRYSRKNLYLVAPGIVLLGVVLAFSVYKLNSLDTEVSAKRVELANERLSLETAKRERVENETNLRKTAVELTKITSQRDQARLELLELQHQRDELRDSVSKIKPSVVTLVLAGEYQRASAERIRRALAEITDERRATIAPQLTSKPPYTIEVRYFRYPEDLVVAQRILLVLQTDFALPMSRISYIQDPTVHQARYVSIHFNARSFQ